MARLALVYFLLFAGTLLLASAAKTWQDLRTVSSGAADVQRRDAVKEAFLFNYRNYLQFAYGFDFINAADKVGENDGTTAGFGGTFVDGLSTMIIMGLQDTPEYKNATAFIRNQSFTSTKEADEEGQPGSVQVFELTIRYLGGLLSAFQINGEQPQERFLVDKAKSLANALKGAWYNNSRIPQAQWNINTQMPVNTSKPSNLAQAGTLTMEWGTLSQYTQDTTYQSLAEKSVDALRETSAFYPGLPFTTIFPLNESTTSHYITIGGGFDSYLEYLIKYPILLGQADHRFIATYTTALESIQKYLVKKSTSNDFTFLSDYDAKRSTNVNVFSHLACFIGGNVAMAGRLMNRDDWTQLGLEFTESCAGTYANTALHLGPYGFGFEDQASQNFSGWNYVSKIQRSFAAQNGFFISVGYWFVAPEILESIFYAYRITHLEFWREMAWEIFQTIKTVADTGNGYVPVVNVNDESSGVLGEQPTFLYAETLMYLYLIFDDSSKYSLDDYVFTTEGHPLRRGSVSHDTFGKVQGTYPYTPITTPVTQHQTFDEKNVEPSSAEDGDLEKPADVFIAQAGAGCFDTARSIASLTGMPQDLALFNIQRFLKRR